MANKKNDKKPADADVEQIDYDHFRNFYQSFAESQRAFQTAQERMSTRKSTLETISAYDPKNPMIAEVTNSPEAKLDSLIKKSMEINSTHLRNYVTQNLDQIVEDPKFRGSLLEKFLDVPAKEYKGEIGEAHEQYLKIENLYRAAEQGDEAAVKQINEMAGRKAQEKYLTQFIKQRGEEIDARLKEDKYLDDDQKEGLKGFLLAPYVKGGLKAVDVDPRALAEMAEKEKKAIREEAREEVEKMFKDDEAKMKYALGNLREYIAEVKDKAKDNAPYQIANFLYGIGQKK